MTPAGPIDEHFASGGSTSRSLLADARMADPTAWERLATLYAPLVASWCRRWGISEQDIVDVVQEVLAAVAGHLDRFRKDRPADTFRGWLLTIARNKARDHFRRRSDEPMAAGGTEATWRIQQVPDRHIDPHDELPGSSEQAIIDALLRRALESIRGEFHDRTWKAFWGVAVDGRAAADVAADLGMQPGAVRVAKSRVLLRLRKELGDSAD
jgi:RNA polymerase sigma-70 factor (ECF subfamily)